MNKLLMSLTAIGTTTVLFGCASGEAPKQEPAALDTQEQKVSYGMGLVLGQRMLSDLPQLQMEQFVEGFRAGYDAEGDSARMTEDEVQQALMAYQQSMREEQEAKRTQMADDNLKKGQEFLKENGEREEVTVTPSGLQYEVLEEGSGEKPSADSQVTVHYTGELIDGTVFDSSRERGEPVTFGLDQVIPGWTQGLQLMPEGSRYKLYIPSELAYGPGGNRAIGPNETLVFDVELLEVDPQNNDAEGDSSAE